MQLKVTRLPHGADIPLPEHATEGSAGMDLRAAVPVLLAPGARAVIPTGLSLAIPRGYVGMLCGRSGLAVRNGIMVMAGVIDSDYRGELGVILVNTGQIEFECARGERIAQLLIQGAYHVDWEEVPTLNETERGTGGFGSTGKA